MNNNMLIYSQVCEVPQSAQKKISGGRLSGMTDINPMWRIRTLTEMFGACGTGWKYVIKDRQFIAGGNGEICVFVDIDLYVKMDGEWQEAIPGTGGSKYIASEKSGLYTDDEAPKKALTDAIGVACKALGIGANIYWEAGSKYTAPTPEPLAATAEQANRIKELTTPKELEEILNKAKVSKLTDMTYKRAESYIRQLEERKSA